MATRQMKRILVTGAVGQIGSELTVALRQKYGGDNVIATGRKTKPSKELLDGGPFAFINVSDKVSVAEVVDKYEIDTIYHMAAILSAVGEENPALCWDVNINGLKNVLDVGVEKKLVRIFVPSSIAVFGPETPRHNTPQDTILKPRTIYGVTKVSAELLCDYYVKRFNVDVRGCRYPGIISYETLPGGGTTDYAVAIFFEAIKNKRYECFLGQETRLPMMYMPDCLKATFDLMDADFGNLEHHADFNVTAMSFSAGELAAEIKKHIPEFAVTYKPDFRQAIADSWPTSLDDSAARREWGWKPDFDMPGMVKDMLRVLAARHKEGKLGY
jgi:nucleoside-diphosphate-sugar epimerase